MNSQYLLSELGKIGAMSLTNMVELNGNNEVGLGWLHRASGSEAVAQRRG